MVLLRGDDLAAIPEISFAGSQELRGCGCQNAVSALGFGTAVGLELPAQERLGLFYSQRLRLILALEVIGDEPRGYDGRKDQERKKSTYVFEALKNC